jgi:hypothetical protein
VCEDGIAQGRIWEARQHCHLYDGYDLPGFGANHREAKNAVVACGDERLHKALSLVDRVCPKHGTRRQFCDTHFDTLTLRLAWREAQRLVEKPEIRRAIDAVEAELFSGIIRQDESYPLPGDRHEFALPGGRAEALIAAAGVFRVEILGDHVCGPACIKPRKPSRRWLLGAMGSGDRPRHLRGLRAKLWWRSHAKSRQRASLRFRTRCARCLSIPASASVPARPPLFRSFTGKKRPPRRIGRRLRLSFAINGSH